MSVRRAAYGTWTSPITAAMAAAGDGRPGFLGTVGPELWWTEPRPGEGGRRTLMRRREDGTIASALPAPWNVRNRVHEYGGTPWAGAVTDDGPLVVFTHYGDQRMYVFAPDSGSEPRPITPEPAVPAGLRWCEMVFAPGGREVWAVLEESTGDRPTQVRRVLAAVPLDGTAAADRAALRELTDDAYRFTTGPRLHPEGTAVAWTAWNHPNMPWDETELRVAEIDAAGRLRHARTVAGGGGESIAQVEWDEAGSLVFTSDRTGWWNLYRMRPDDGWSQAVFPAASEFAGPLWTLGTRWFQVLENGRIAAVHGRGRSVLGIVGDPDATDEEVGGRWSEWAPGLAATGSKVYGLAAGPDSGYEVVEYDADQDQMTVVAAPHADVVDPAYYPVPRERTFQGPDGRDVHAHVYPPRNPEFDGPEGQAPPYVVWVHGGPTSHVRAVLDLELAYFTSRGIGVVEVNYGGSTGYGREYRDRLHGRWGVVDVEDCAAVARALADEGTADPDRLAIRGGSAGGWTAAASLTSPAAAGLYACATVKYPILTLAGWTGDHTHDFESRYVHSLVGPGGELESRSAERSPVDNAERISAPFALLQGLEDRICPPEQCELLLERIAGRGVPHAYLTFEGEQHGFRRADTIVRAIEAEHSLYAQTFGFDAPAVPRLELRS